jgi:transposase InsO family protein
MLEVRRTCLGRRCRLAGIEQAMGRRGSACDSSGYEAISKTSRASSVDRHSRPMRAELRAAVLDYFERYYNRQRRHSTLSCPHQPSPRESTSEHERASIT